MTTSVFLTCSTSLARRSRIIQFLLHCTRTFLTDSKELSLPKLYKQQYIAVHLSLLQ